MKGETKMHICDKCNKFNKCYKGMSKTAEAHKKDSVLIDGCPDFKELTIEQMFGLKEGVLSE